MLSVALAFLMNWLILFAVCYILVEYGQYFLYDEATPNKGLKVGAGSFVLAAALTYKPLSYGTMFTSDIGWAVGQAVLWFAVFALAFRFHPQHAAGIGVVAMVLVAGMAGMAVDSFRESRRPTQKEKMYQFNPADKSQGLRKSAASPPGPGAPTKGEPPAP